ncbi:MAG: Outer membrane protein assembly factor BamC [Candidatus Celerinatantimonas neptuna]|nr:MAG: Outer membrane protein assembly factor BamC [Candidatus Celerinatantimonas neptuna]
MVAYLRLDIAEKPLFVSSRVRLVLAGSTLLFLSACADNHPKQAIHGFSYLKAKSGASLVVPSPYSQPKYSKKYSVLALPTDYTYLHNVGDKVDIRPPEQLIPLVASELHQSKEGPQLWLDKPDAHSSSQSIQWLYHQVEGYLQSHNAHVEKSNHRTYIESGWIKQHFYLDDGVFSHESITYKRRFRYDLKASENGQYAIFQPHLLAMKSNSKHPFDQSEQSVYRQNVMEINRFVAYLQKQSEKAKVARFASTQDKAIQSGKIDLLFKQNEGVALMYAKASLLPTLDALKHALPILGFKITGYISEAGKVYLTYEQPSSRKLARYGVKPVRLAEDKYVLTVGGEGDRTQMTISDSDGNLLTPIRVQKLYPALRKMLALGSKPIHH